MLAAEAGILIFSVEPVAHRLSIHGDPMGLLGRAFERLDELVSIVHADDAQRVSDTLSRAMDEGRSGRLDCRISGVVCREAHLRMVWQAEPHTNGRFELHGLLQDTTALTKTREALNEANRLAALAEKLGGVGYWRIREGGDTFVWSDQMYRIYGLDPSSPPLSVQGIIDHCHPDDREKLIRHHAKYLGKEAPEISVRIVRPNGEIRHVLARSMVERDEAGAVIARFGTLADVTDIKRAEAAAIESEQRYRFLADYAPDMITRTNLMGEALYVSPSSVRVFGYTPEEHMRLRPIDMVHPDDAPWVMEKIFKLIASRQQRLPEPLCYRAKHKNGHWIWIEANPTLIFDDRGEPIEFVDVLRDVSQTKRFEEELKQARKRAEAAAAAKSAFLANMSHELRTPLTSIIGFSRLMGERRDLPAEAMHYTKCIGDASEALLAVINQVLDFSKLEAGQVVLDVRPLAIQELVEEATGLIAIQAAEKGLKVTIELDPHTPDKIIGDVARLRQVLLNFLSNAVKFTDRGSITVKTAYWRHAGKPRLKISVIDTGSGIAPEAVSRLFERFSQAEVSTNRSHGGTGLGLSISKSVVDLMGGEIGIETELGKGSCFWFEIPAQPAPNTAIKSSDANEPLHGASLRILLVDDTAINRELIKLMLMPHGFVIEEAAGGADAVQAATLRPFDLIFMDVRMPRVDGIEATNLIRSTSLLNRATPILALTADIEPDNAVACRAAGMNDIIAKPIVLEQLLSKIAEWTTPDSQRAVTPRRVSAGKA
jgi:PAS domain S-box-containing protein